MTEQDKDQQLGRLVREHADIRKTIASLKVEASRLAKIYADIGERLSREPQNLIFEKESHDSRFEAAYPIKASDIDGKRLLQLTNEIRDSMVRQDEIAQQLNNLGFDVTKIL